MNFFIEGLQGSGKSTLVQKLADKYKDHIVFREGDYSPVELAWCTWMSNDAYEKALKKYPSLKEEMNEKTVTEGSHRDFIRTWNSMKYIMGEPLGINLRRLY